MIIVHEEQKGGNRYVSTVTSARDRPFICKFESFSRPDDADFLHGYMDIQREREREREKRRKKATRPDCYHSDSERARERESVDLSALLDRPRHDPLVMQRANTPHVRPFLRAAYRVTNKLSIGATDKQFVFLRTHTELSDIKRDLWTVLNRDSSQGGSIRDL